MSFAVLAAACSRNARAPEGDQTPARPLISTLATELRDAQAASDAPTPSPSASVEGAAGGDANAQGDAGEPPTAERTPDVIYVPTPESVVDKMLEVANVRKGDVLYDLGCGDGRIVVTAAKRFGIKAFGFDVDPARIEESKANAKAAGVEHLVTFEQKDIFTLDLSPATVVTLYLLPELNVRLIPQLEKLRPGARVVSHDFDMEGVEYEKSWALLAPDHDGPGDREHYVYLWKTPLKKSPLAP